MHSIIRCGKKMKKKSAARFNNCDGAKPKERHIVSWSQEEDDILRDQIRIHGIDNWKIIASNFKDKTVRQCKRRWFTYLNSDFKKGGWSPEEDMLLCEKKSLQAQKIFGNRWTEIAKVVSGRTDNAVKNRFTTICKKKAKNEAMAKVNITSYINLKNKRVMFSDRLDTDRISDVSEPIKKLRRSHTIERSVDDCPNKNQPLRHPFAVLAQNGYKETSENGTFLEKSDPKINVLMQQAELQSSLSLKVNSESTNQSLENAWKILQDFLHQTKKSDVLKFRLPEMNPGNNTHNNLITNSSGNEESRPSKWQPALSEESGGSSEYSTISTLLPLLSKRTEDAQVKPCAHYQEIQSGLQNSQIGDQNGVQELENGIFCDLSFPHADTPRVCDEMRENHGSTIAECEYRKTDFGSPVQVTPQFRSLAAAIPSPKFTESERQFLLKTLGVESTSPHRSAQPPSCKRALLQSL